MKRIEIDSLSQLDMVAEEVINELNGRSVVLFRGGMGAGKTTLISRIAAALGSEDNVTSPTFALVNQYEGEGDCRIYHFDFYRIDSIDEVFDLGYEEYFYSGDLCLVEWPEKIEPLIPEDVMEVRITVADDDSRIFEIE
ncbi:MAG: tRNA (adenosine(37)-N6)-threonylcarbamoyltransferase complex ATPase subunit type 1 TsaE [Alistipes sp.]|nr:tRNA (adenosine(37)-N6)-threonylcarbamoyltransferase complex ATPase subunit type 1 TsaE [Alistipes sp.]